MRAGDARLRWLSVAAMRPRPVGMTTACVEAIHFVPKPIGTLKSKGHAAQPSFLGRLRPLRSRGSRVERRPRQR